MRGVARAALVTFALGGMGCAGAAPMTPAPAAPAAETQALGDRPAWLPAYTAAQRALLAPVETPIQVPAARVYPDLHRFQYAGPARLDDLRRTIRFSTLIVTVIDKSPRLYSLDDAAPELANLVAQYGPPPPAEPDPWQTAEVVRKDRALTLTPVKLSDEAKTSLAAARSKRDAGETKAAAEAFRAALGSTRAAGIALELGEMLVAQNQPKEAREAFEEAIGIDPTLATAHLRLAELAEKRADREEARRRLAEAIAFWPASRRAIELADRLSNGLASSRLTRLPLFRVFLDVDSVGAIHVGSSGGDPARVYAGCRAVMRYEPEVRARIFEQPEDVPYHLTMMEELICLESALGTYVAARMSKGGAAVDPAMEALLEVAHEEGLGGYVMTEILGRHRPERARSAPREVHEAMVRYVERTMLGAPLVADPAQGVYTAAR
ncbi:tetratricopeptide repeat protein [Polyangium sp. y55x31]|uniref:tetratricopeptide repeat protein n=1 Tax=Polyangium sp. y55x31 TaxID=3042688 RepID=UPI002482925B|nr:tetratricopeptide repeat protein [Polyangium sp. y55x31]MDI1484063.1 tetratricopeptide repeat protein [Polyangium sp. y55x31]